MITLRIDQIEIPATMRPYHAFRTVEIARSIRAGEPIAPLAVALRDGHYVFVGDRDVLEAWKLVGAEKVPVHAESTNWRTAHLMRRKAA